MRLRLDGIDWSDLAQLPEEQRRQLGVAPSGRWSRLVENYLAKYSALRKLFKLSNSVYIEPTFDYGVGDSTASAYSWYNAQLAFERDRRQVYRLVEEMDTFDLVSGSLDLYAEEATQPDMETGLTVWVESNSTRVMELCHQMFNDIQLEDKIFGIARTVAKYGDDFEEVVLDRDKGVVALNYVYPGRLTRIEDEFGRLLGFAAGIITDSDLANAEFRKKLNISRPFDFINFRLLSSRREFKHGESMLMSARYSWRQLKIMEDSIIVYRLNRSPDRLVHYIDVTGMGRDEAMQTLNMYRTRLRRKLHVDSATGQVRQEYNPFSVIDDLYVPTTKDGASKIEKLSGSSNLDDLTDVEHFRRKLFGSLRVPAAFLGFEGDIDTKTGLSQQDIRFARSVKRLRRALQVGLTTLCKIHLIYNNVDIENPDNRFFVRMAPIALLEEMQRREIMNMRMEMVDRMIGLLSGLGIEGPERFAWIAYVLVDYLGLTEQEVVRYFGSIAKKVGVGGTTGVSLSSDSSDIFGGEYTGSSAGLEPGETFAGEGSSAGTVGGSEGGSAAAGGGEEASSETEGLRTVLLRRLAERAAASSSDSRPQPSDEPIVDTWSQLLDKEEDRAVYDLTEELDKLRIKAVSNYKDSDGNCVLCGGSKIKEASIQDDTTEDDRPIGRLIVCLDCGNVGKVDEPYLDPPRKLGRKV